MQAFTRPPEPYRRPRLGRKFLGGLTVLLLGSFVLICISLAQGPDRDLELVQEIQIPQSTMNPSNSTDPFHEAISDVNNWPHWHHLLTHAQTDNGISEIVPGSQVQLTLKPKNNKKTSTLVVEILEYDPHRLLHVRLLHDSRKELTRLFDRFEWTLEKRIGPDTQHIILRGRLHVHTANWRSRLFGGLSQMTRDGMLRGIFYVDLQALAHYKPTSAREIQKAAGQEPASLKVKKPKDPRTASHATL